MDPNLYRETFSQLRASEKAKEEVFQMMENKKTRRLPGLARMAVMAAMMAMALAVTAGAVNLATDGMLFHILWSRGNEMELVDDAGNHVHVTVADVEVVQEKDGRLLIQAGGDSIDITDELAEQGHYHYEYAIGTAAEESSEAAPAVTIDVTGDLDHWTATQSDGSGVSYTTTGGREAD